MISVIVREKENSFTMIEQHNHALLARDLIRKWKENHFWHDPLYKEVLYAIENHDRGWQMFDKQPFWNDVTSSPYAFTDFPTLAKTVLYKQGIDEVEKVSPYAAMLCSEHYMRFMSHTKHKEAERFVAQEQQRKERIISSLSAFDKAVFNWHYELLKFADNVSLYICLNEPGVKKHEEHKFFRAGIPVAKSLLDTQEGGVEAYWKNQNTICLDPFPFSEAIHVTVPLKNVSQESIADIGLLKSYEATNDYNEEITLQSKL